jgi:hypothetical protein
MVRNKLAVEIMGRRGRRQEKSAGRMSWLQISVCFVTVRHRCSRPAMDETGILGFVFVLLNLHFCFLLGHDFKGCGKTRLKRLNASGHDFSRAVNSLKNDPAFRPCGESFLL